tara:strand:+ start:1548 stop:1751 length:204 start_codon:yes stop_codon:yes gene_type:complete
MEKLIKKYNARGKKLKDRIEFLKGSIEKNKKANRLKITWELERKLERDSRELNIFKDIVEDLKLLKL